ncbi:hypothetical protein ILYODFUR_012294 [Ilyodon furcidens]|uniref:Uncharacterized protein n=1 Tax=Ilyodon furcidens TaxID=33524 RepID=A0ABV0UFF0_9TELE
MTLRVTAPHYSAMFASAGHSSNYTPSVAETASNTEWRSVLLRQKGCNSLSLKEFSSSATASCMAWETFVQQ